MSNKKELTVEDLQELLLENEISGFDPVAEAFRVFAAAAPLSSVDAAAAYEGGLGSGAAAGAGAGSGALGPIGLNGERLRTAFLAYGMGELSDEELAVLFRVRNYRLISTYYDQTYTP